MKVDRYLSVKYHAINIRTTSLNHVPLTLARHRICCVDRRSTRHPLCERYRLVRSESATRRVDVCQTAGVGLHVLRKVAVTQTRRLKNYWYVVFSFLHYPFLVYFASLLLINLHIHHILQIICSFLLRPREYKNIGTKRLSLIIDVERFVVTSRQPETGGW